MCTSVYSGSANDTHLKCNISRHPGVFLLNKPGSHNIAEKWLKMMIQTNVHNSQYIPTINLVLKVTSFDPSFLVECTSLF